MATPMAQRTSGLKSRLGFDKVKGCLISCNGLDIFIWAACCAANVSVEIDLVALPQHMYHSHPSPSSLQSILSLSPEQESMYLLQPTQLIYRPKEVKEVRFRLLTPPPEESQEPMDPARPRQRDENRPPRRAASVKPMNDKVPDFKFGSAVTWGPTELTLLNVSVLGTYPIDLDESVFKAQGVVLPAELEERTCCVVSLIVLGVRIEAEKLEAIDLSKLEKGSLRMKDVLRIAPAFVSTFTAMLNLMRVHESKVPAKEPKIARPASSQVSVSSSTASNVTPQAISTPILSSSTETSYKRPAPDPIPLDSKRTRQILVVAPPNQQMKSLREPL
jgi:hypothetical protein